jgi:hypothetical protein
LMKRFGEVISIRPKKKSHTPFQNPEIWFDYFTITSLNRYKNSKPWCFEPTEHITSWLNIPGKNFYSDQHINLYSVRLVWGCAAARTSIALTFDKFLVLTSTTLTSRRTGVSELGTTVDVFDFLTDTSSHTMWERPRCSPREEG